MNDSQRLRLLAADEPAPFAIENAGGASPYLLICDHAGRRIPRALGDLGVSAADMQRHIAWDIGAAGVASVLSAALDAFLVRQTYSRLVIDCNRPFASPGSIAIRSEDTDIPGNVGIGADAVAARRREIFAPYHACIEAELDRRAAAGLPSVLVSVHSFTPVFRAIVRPWKIGTLYGADARLAHRLLEIVRAEGVWHIGDNEPYSVSPATDYAIPVHGERRGIPHVALEIRQDLIEGANGQREWGERIAGWLRAVDLAALERIRDRSSNC